MPNPKSSPTLSLLATESLMFRETGEAAAVAHRFLTFNHEKLVRLGIRLRANRPKFMVTCARGSSDHAATYAKYLFETFLGIPTASAALSVTSVFNADLSAGEAVCIAISQSGRSPDLLATVKAYKAAGAYTIAIVNDEAAPLVDLADETLYLAAGPELSVAATKTCLNSLCAVAALTATWSQIAPLQEAVADLPRTLARAMALDWGAVAEPLKSATNLFIIGRGYSFPIAQEAALKLKETCGIHAEAFSSAEVRHGPMAIVKEGFPIIAFACSDLAGDDVRSVCLEFKRRGAKVYLSDAGDLTGGLPTLKGHPALEPLPMLASFYRLANSLAFARGLNPDSPPYLNKVTRTT